MENEKEIKTIFNTVERINSNLVENNMEHLDVIIDAYMFGIGANIRFMAGDEPSAVRENFAITLKRFEEFMENTIDMSQTEWNQRALH